MVKVSVFYPNKEGVTFDMDYYCNTHVPMVRELMGDSLKNLTIEKGLAGGNPSSPAPYAAMGNMYFDTVEIFQGAFDPNVEEIMGDLPNFTGVEPIIQISKVMI